jgi:hypothetical protein
MIKAVLVFLLLMALIAWIGGLFGRRSGRWRK